MVNSAELVTEAITLILIRDAMRDIIFRTIIKPAIAAKPFISELPIYLSIANFKI